MSTAAKRAVLETIYDKIFREDLPSTIAEVLPDGQRVLRRYQHGRRGARVGYDYQVFRRILSTIENYAGKLSQRYPALKPVAEAADTLTKIFSLPDLAVSTEGPEALDEIRKRYGAVVAEFAAPVVQAVGGFNKEARRLLRDLLNKMYEKYRQNLSNLVDVLADTYLDILSKEAPVTIVIKPEKRVPGVGVEATVTANPQGMSRFSIAGLATIRAEQTCLGKSEAGCIYPGIKYYVRIKIPTEALGSNISGWMLAAAAYPLAKQITRGKSWINYELEAAESPVSLTGKELAVVVASTIAEKAGDIRELF
jgi:hypothetical protein